MRLQLGDAATLALDAFPGAVLNGEVSEIAAVANERTGVFEVEISVDGKAVVDAVTTAAVTRCRPIIITTLTTVCSLLPMT